MAQIIKEIKIPLKVGVAIPCHINDVELCFKYPIPSLRLLNPSPHKIIVDINSEGYGGLKGIRTRLFDRLFDVYKCDIILSVCADYRIINRNLLNEMSIDKVMNYGRFFNTPIIGLVHYLARRCTKKPWSAMHSIPREIWFNEVRNNPLYTGMDGSVARCVNLDYESHMGINYMLMRRNTKRLIHGALNNPEFRKRSFFKRVLKMSQGIKI